LLAGVSSKFVEGNGETCAVAVQSRFGGNDSAECCYYRVSFDLRFPSNPLQVDEWKSTSFVVDN